MPPKYYETSNKKTKLLKTNNNCFVTKMNIWHKQISYLIKISKTVVVAIFDNCNQHSNSGSEANTLNNQFSTELTSISSLNIYRENEEIQPFLLTADIRLLNCMYFLIIKMKRLIKIVSEVMLVLKIRSYWNLVKKMLNLKPICRYKIKMVEEKCTQPQFVATLSG